ncbi:energy-coupling factor transporter transmembrane protein EcfT [Nakamurella sp. YIM 132087]|uniref:Energy-coupling factor transporter transmembrane protein EcfT n=1 Tax=Nakamurella alba TaxID=2665158 RepID=A0A7K1FN89_9ACTN|nr:energy-coupling factor transporter transmembrane component T [Nakamurella alba]MTD15637.1 energy-coupling factor transporter transmembrane protein EcfT [Nakamurella alba]
MTAQVRPEAWWIWALCLAATADRTTNPILLATLIAVTWFVVSSCRSREPWAPGWTRGFAAFFKLALVVLAIRTVFHILLGSPTGGPVLFTLPTVHLPDWATGIGIGGPVYADGLLGTLYAALSLAVLLCCVGAAVALADPRRLLAALPGALYEVGVAVVVAMSLAPELLAGAQRVRRARELRGDATAGRGLLRRIRAWARLALPLLADATDRALTLAASMDGRGYGREGGLGRTGRRWTAGLVLVGLGGLVLGIYGLLDTTTPLPVTVLALVIGCGAAVAGLTAGSRRVVRTRYRTDPWTWRDGVVIGSGLVALAGSVVGGLLDAPLDPPDLLALPPLPVLPFVAVLVAALPGLLLPTRVPPVHRAADPEMVTAR